MKDRKIFSLDRVEGELAVCISDDEEQVVVSLKSLGGLAVHDVFSARTDGTALFDIESMPEERDRRLEKNRARLLALAKRSKNR